MTVMELIEELKKLDQSARVILQGDPEGNFYEFLEGVDDNAVWTSDKEVRKQKIDADDLKAGYTEEDLGEGEHVVVLFP